MHLTTVEKTDEPMLFREADGAITLSIPIRIRKYSGRQQIVLPKNLSFNDFKEKQDLTILQAALARAKRWQNLLDDGRVQSLRDIAISEKVDPSYVSRVMNLNLLGPELVQRILDDDLEAETTFNDFCIDMPLAWQDQGQRVKKT
jgi:hypothetical protein